MCSRYSRGINIALCTGIALGTCVYVYVFVFIYVFVYVYACAYVYVYVFVVVVLVTDVLFTIRGQFDSYIILYKMQVLSTLQEDTISTKCTKNRQYICRGRVKIFKTI